MSASTKMDRRAGGRPALPRLALLAGLVAVVAGAAAGSTPADWPYICSAFPPGETTVPDCARRTPDGEVVLRPGVVADGGSVQAVIVEGELLFALPSGRTAPALPFDNGPDPFVEGLARSPRDGKVGFVDEELDLAVPREWDFAFPFEDGVARVCTGCTLRREEGQEHTEVAGGHWGYVDRRGRVVVPVEHERDALPPPPAADGEGSRKDP